MPRTSLSPIIVQDTESGDHRLIKAVSFREFPLSARWVRQDVGAHQGAEDIGVLKGAVQDGVLWMGEVEHLDGEPGSAAFDAAALAEQGAQFWSADPGAVEYHYEIIGPDGKEVDPVEVNKAYDAMYYGGDDAETAKAFLESLYERMVFDSYEVAGITQVGIPAFPQCRIAFTTEGASSETDTTDRTTSSARRLLRRLAAGPQSRPASWYAQQTFARYTELTITDKGQIMGHVAPWNACHRSFSHTCEKPDYQTEFDDFHTGEALLDDGTRMRVGVITHVDGHLDSIAAYTRVAEDPACQLGSVRAYADQWGIQVAGAVHPDVTPAEITRALAGRPSGDWRGPAGARRLFAIAMVNTPGYTGYVERDEAGVNRVVASAPPPLPDGLEPPVGQVFFDAPPSIITAACACENPPADPPSAAPVVQSIDLSTIAAQGISFTGNGTLWNGNLNGTTADLGHEDCGCGGEAGHCTCDEPTLSPKDLADLAYLDLAADTIKGRIAHA